MNVQSSTRSDAERVIEMQHTYEEQQSHVDNMIQQVALLTEMMKEIKENRARSEVNGSAEKEEGVREAEEGESAEVEKESEALMEEEGTADIDSDEKVIQPEEKSMTTPPDGEAPMEILEEARDEPREGKEEAIERDEEVNNTLFCLQSEKVHVPDEMVEEFTNVEKEESTSEERPPPVIDKSKGCCYEEEESEWKEEERSKRKAAKAIYWVQLQPWPEP